MRFRAFGGTACAGVMLRLEYRKLFMQPGDGHYVTTPADGISVLLGYAKVVEPCAKKLRLKAPVRDGSRLLLSI